jgi:integrase
VGWVPIGRLTFHGLRRTFASLRCACGDDVAYTSAQLGHTDPRFTLGVYTKATNRRERMAAIHRREYDRALVLALMTALDDLETVPMLEAQAAKSPV